VSVANTPEDGTPEGARPAGRGYWFTPVPTYLIDAVYEANSPVNAPAVILWAHIHRHYAWRERIFPSYATLAAETSTGERTIARLLQTLRSAGALTWDAGFSLKGRSSNQYALAPFKAFEFDREPPPSVPAKNGKHRGEPAKNGSHHPAKNGGHPHAKNGRGIESSFYLESTGEGTVLPSVLTPEVVAREAASVDGGTDGGSSSIAREENHAAAGGYEPATADAGPVNDKDAATETGASRGVPSPAAPLPATPGVELLRAIRAELPAWDLDKDTIRDQGLLVTGMLDGGFTPGEIRDAFARRLPPENLTHTIGAVAARRLRDLIEVGPRAGVQLIPQQTDIFSTGHGGSDDAMFDRQMARARARGGTDERVAGWLALSRDFAAQDAAVAGRDPIRNCAEDDAGGSGCDRVAAPGEDRCATHLGWEPCPQCSKRRARPGQTVCDHCEDAATTGPVSSDKLAELLAEATRRANQADAPA